MIIITEEFGQLSNRLYALAPFFAYCHQRKIRIICFSFGSYAENYPSLNKSDYCSFLSLRPKALALFQRLLLLLSRKRILSRCPNVAVFDLFNKKPLREENIAKKICFLDPWHHPKPPISPAGEKVLRKIFAPKRQVQNQVNNYLEKNNPNQKPLLAIHARRGDYRVFKGGEWFYSETDYIRIIQGASAAVQTITGKCPIIFVVSDEPEFLAQGEWIRSPFQSAITDQFLLSCANFIIGPPSTFSHWAALMGQNLIAFVTTVSNEIQPNDFLPPPPFSYPSLLEHSSSVSE